MEKQKKIRVFVAGGQQMPKNKLFQKHAMEIGELLGKNGNIEMIQGGSPDGLMGLSYQGFLKYSNDIEIVVPKAYAYQSEGMKVKKKIVVEFINDRVNHMIFKSDVIVFIVGGLGTIDEILSAAESKRNKEHNAELIVLNSGNFYKGLIKQLQNMVNHKLIYFPIFELIEFADTPTRVMDLINDGKNVTSGFHVSEFEKK